MKLHKVGDKSRALCEHCGEIRATTFRERDVPLSSGRGTVRDVLVSVCDVCDSVAAIPAQSAPKVRETIQSIRHPVEARIPRHLQDAMYLVCVELGGDTDAAPLVFRYYIRRLTEQPTLVRHLAALAASEEASGRATARFSARLNEPMHELWKNLLDRVRLNETTVLKGMIMQMKRDVLDNKKPDVRKELQTVLQLA